MRHVLLIVLCCTFSLPAVFADPWDNLTKKQAEETVEYLKKYPFILDYCDCCDHSGEYATEVFLMRVISTEIIPSDWSDGDFSVRATVQKIAQIPYLENGPDLSKATAANSLEEYIILMNYTFGFHPETKKAVALFDVIDYDKYGEADYCKAPTPFPNPAKLKKYFKDKAYCSWYKKNVK